MKKFIIVFLVLLALRAECFCQVLPSAREIGMSNSTIADSDNSFSLFYNPACLSQITNRQIGVYYSPSPFGLKELANGYAVYHEPFSFMSAAIGVKNYGFKLYRENEVTLGLSKDIDNKYFLGFAITFSNISIKKYGQTNMLSASFGDNISVTPELFFGASVRNIYLANYSEYLKKPLQLEAGFCYYLPYFTVTSSILKEEYFEPSYAFGIEIKLIKYVDLRAGFRNFPSSFSFGAGINYSFFEIDYSAFNNSLLGFTHQFGLLINFHKETDKQE